MNVTWTQEMVEDIKCAGIFKYIIENKIEENIIHKYFKVELIDDKIVYLSYDQKTKRRLKLSIIKNDEDSIIIKKIIVEAKQAGFDEYIELKMVKELSKEIDKKILEDFIRDNYLKK